MPKPVHNSTLKHTPTLPSTNSSPISLLTEDVLWHIFSLNADMDGDTARTSAKDHALTTLRYTSHVCASWRDLTIGSSTLWARVLNLNALCQRRDEWRKEVLRRTGTALLYIKSGGYCLGKRYVTAELIESILAEHWTRIRSLDLDRIQYDNLDTYRWRDLFQRPAPSLEVFKFSMPTWYADRLYAPDFVLFSNQAPALRTLSVTDMRVDLTTLSIPNLRNLILCSSEWISPFELLVALNHMPLLETLKATTDRPFFEDENTKRSLPQVTLPHLIAIAFFGIKGGDIPIVLSFLAQITPARGCVLEFDGNYMSESPDHASEDLCGRILSKYSTHCTELVDASNLRATIGQAFVTFEVDISFHHRFSFTLEINQIGLPESTISILLSSISVLRLNSIKKLNLSLDHRGTTPSNTDVANFILALVSVEELETNAPTFVSLQNIQSNTTFIIFPSLKIITLNRSFERFQEILGVADFINARTDLGRIPTVQTRSSDHIDLNPLVDLVPGLTIQIL